MKNTTAHKSRKETRSLLRGRYVLAFVPFQTLWRLSRWLYYTVISSAYCFSHAKRTSPLQCHVISFARGQYPVARGLGTWQVDWCHSVSWNHTNGDQLLSVPDTVFLTCIFCSNMFCYHLRMKAIGFTEKGPWSENGASLYLHGLSISFIPRTNLEITWLFTCILSWITVAKQRVWLK